MDFRRVVFCGAIVACGLVVPGSGAAAAPEPRPASDTLTEAASLVQAGRYDSAVRIYDDIIRRGRNSLEVHEALYRKGLCLQALKKFEAARDCWLTLLRRYARTEWNDDALLDLGRMHAFGMNAPDKAMPYLERLIRDYPASERLTEAHFYLGRAAYMTGDYKKALASFETALDRDSGGGLAADIREHLSRTTTAVESLDRGRLVKPGSDRDKLKTPSAGKATSIASSRHDPSKQKMIDDIKGAEVLFAKGDIRGAMSEFQRITRFDVWGPGYDQALFRLGQCQAALGEQERAIQTWRKVVLLAGLHPSCEFADESLLAQAETWLDAFCRPDKAIECARELISTYPESDIRPNAEYITGLALLFEGKPDQALAVFESEAACHEEDAPPEESALSDKRVEKPPDRLKRLVAVCRGAEIPGILLDGGIMPSLRSAPLIRMGDMYFTAREYSKAGTAYEKAFREAQGTEAAAYAVLQAGRCYNQLMQYRRALRCYDLFLTKFQDSRHAPAALLRAGVIHVGPLNDMVAGAKAYETIGERYPNSSEAETAKYHLATLAYWKREFDRAMPLYREVAETWPNGRYALFIEHKKIPELEELTKRGS